MIKTLAFILCAQWAYDRTEDPYLYGGWGDPVPMVGPFLSIGDDEKLQAGSWDLQPFGVGDGLDNVADDNPGENSGDFVGSVSMAFPDRSDWKSYWMPGRRGYLVRDADRPEYEYWNEYWANWRVSQSATFDAEPCYIYSTEFFIMPDWMIGADPRYTGRIQWADEGRGILTGEHLTCPQCFEFDRLKGENRTERDILARIANAGQMDIHPRRISFGEEWSGLPWVVVRFLRSKRENSDGPRYRQDFDSADYHSSPGWCRWIDLTTVPGLPAEPAEWKPELVSIPYWFKRLVDTDNRGTIHPDYLQAAWQQFRAQASYDANDSIQPVTSVAANGQIVIEIPGAGGEHRVTRQFVPGSRSIMDMQYNYHLRGDRVFRLPDIEPYAYDYFGEKSIQIDTGELGYGSLKYTQETVDLYEQEMEAIKQDTDTANGLVNRWVGGE